MRHQNLLDVECCASCSSATKVPFWSFTVTTCQRAVLSAPSGCTSSQWSSVEPWSLYMRRITWVFPLTQPPPSQTYWMFQESTSKTRRGSENTEASFLNHAVPFIITSSFQCVNTPTCIHNEEQWAEMADAEGSRWGISRASWSWRRSDHVSSGNCTWTSRRQLLKIQYPSLCSLARPWVLTVFRSLMLFGSKPVHGLCSLLSLLLCNARDTPASHTQPEFPSYGKERTSGFTHLAYLCTSHWLFAHLLRFWLYGDWFVILFVFVICK